ncbi:PaaI family thioesterase [bacterium]|nr:PaaI family thioesterase [bacterium]
MAPTRSLSASLVTPVEVNDFARRDFPGNESVCEEVGPGWAQVVLQVGRGQLRPGGIIGGPTIFGICDVALYYACFTAIGIEPMTVTSGLSIHFLRPATGPLLHARADLSSVGRRNLCGNIVAWTDSRETPVAVAQGVYVRPGAKASKG